MAKNLSDVKIKDPKLLLVDMLKATSGAEVDRSIKYNIFYRLIAFKGAAHGVGCSTIVANTAVALAGLGLNVAVVDTSMLAPVQDTLLKTKLKDDSEDEKIYDWFDMPYTKISVLHVSKRSKNISVLSFIRKDRTVLNVMSTQDNAELADMALETLQSKFDIVLFDLCDELTEVNTACLQKAQRVIQVYSDSIACVSNIDKNITNSVILSCPMDKMRYVVENKTIDDTIGSLDGLYKQYKFKCIAHCGFSSGVARVASMNSILFQHPTDDEGIIEFTEMILDIVCLLCNIDDGRQPRGTITADDIEAGKVKGTLHYKDKKINEKAPKVTVVTPQTIGELDEAEDLLEEEEEQPRRGLFGRRKS